MDVLPQTVDDDPRDQPDRPPVTIDGQPLTAPQDVLGVVNITRTLGAPSPQGGQHTFVSWSDGGAQTHDISTPAEPLHGTFTGRRYADPNTGTPTVTPTPTRHTRPRRRRPGRPRHADAEPGAPVVSSIAPTSGLASGGTASTITGANFVPGATVTIGGVAATGVDVTDGTHVAATVPALTPGTLNDVTVTNLDQLFGTLAKGWFADFLDVPQDNLFHADVEKIFRAAITAGCGDGTLYCVTSPVTRAQMAVFLLKSEHGSTYVPPDCALNPISFPDVACPSLFADWIEQLAAEGITAGCGGGNYCPDASVTRQQMAVFLLKTEHGSAYVPPDCAGNPISFLDVPCPSQYANWIEQLAAEGITAGCGGGNYCPPGPGPEGPDGDLPVQDVPAVPGAPCGPPATRPEGRSIPGLTGRPPLRILTRPPTRGPSPPAPLRVTLRVRF